MIYYFKWFNKLNCIRICVDYSSIALVDVLVFFCFCNEVLAFRLRYDFLLLRVHMWYTSMLLHIIRIEFLCYQSVVWLDTEPPITKLWKKLRWLCIYIYCSSDGQDVFENCWCQGRLWVYCKWAATKTNKLGGWSFRWFLEASPCNEVCLYHRKTFWHAIIYIDIFL